VDLAKFGRCSDGSCLKSSKRSTLERNCLASLPCSKCPTPPFLTPSYSSPEPFCFPILSHHSSVLALCGLCLRLETAFFPMPPDRGRASKACATCRKQKTRCYETSIGRACLRCDRLGQECSLSSATPSFRQSAAYSRPSDCEGAKSHDNDERYQDSDLVDRKTRTDV